MIRYGIVVHGGAGTPEEYSDVCRQACEQGFEMLGAGQSSLDAVVEAVRMLEDDGRFNAGSGAALRIDGKTTEMDAALMDSGGRIGVVINVRHVRNPILLARAVLDTPHLAMAGRGAEMLARESGLKRSNRVSAESMKRFERLKEAIKEGSVDPFWKKYAADTVGAVAVDGNGLFAVASSTGGASPMLVGRVGDTPMVGCGFYAGEHGAVALTGLGEEIIRRMSARYIYDLIAGGGEAGAVCLRGLELFPEGLGTGAIAISKDGHAAVSSKGMACYALVSSS